MQYIYEDVFAEPATKKIREEIAEALFSEALSAAIPFEYSPSENWLKIQFEGELTALEKTALDAIVFDSIGKVLDTKKDSVVMHAIFEAASALQQSHLVAALDKYPTWQTALKMRNYPLAQMRMQEAYDAGFIDAAELALVQSFTPSGGWVTP